MREFLLFNNVGTVLLDPTAPHSNQALALFSDSMGPPQKEGGLDVWFHAQRLARAVAAKVPGG